MALKRSIAIGIAGRHFRAVEAQSSRDDLRISRVISTLVPETIDLEDAAALGGWVAEQCREAGMARGRAIFSVPREHVSLKRIVLPTIDRYELPEMVRLAMQRDLPFDAADAVIDYVIISQSRTESIVLVAAMQQRMIEHLQKVAKHARLRVDRISLRCMGLATLLRTGEEVSDEHNAMLGVDLTGDGAEIVFIANGGIRFSRAARITAHEEIDATVDAVITEARRSWMSYRMMESAPDVAAALIIGPKELADEVATGVGDLLKIRADVLERHPRIDVDEDVIGTCWPLAGLLLERHLGVDALDFASPTKAPDRNARRRVVAYAAAAALFIVVSMLMLLAMKDLRDLEDRERSLREQVNAEARGHFRYERDVRLAQHLERWQQTHVDWLSHFAAIGERLPGNDMVVLGPLTGNLRTATVGFDTRTREWHVAREVVFSLDGEATSQSVVDQVRRSLAEDSRYAVQPTGPDSEGGKRYRFPFKLTLRTNVESPLNDGEEQERAGEARDAANGTRGDRRSELEARRSTQRGRSGS